MPASFARAIAAFGLVGPVWSVGNAHAVVIPQVRLLTTSVPANGVLHFSYMEGPSVSVLAPDGSLVPGNFVGNGVWRPEAPFTVGPHTVDFTWQEHPSWVHDGTFEVTAAVAAPTADLVQLEVTTQVVEDSSRPLEDACCLEGKLHASECADVCPPLCVPVVYESKQVVMVTVHWPFEELGMQFIINEVAMLEPGDYQQGYWDVVGSPDEICGAIEVFSWLDESTTELRTCIDNPRPELPPIRETVGGFGINSECTVPPVGYETLWCEERAYACEEWLLSADGQTQADLALACEHYDEICRPVDSSNDDSANVGTSNSDDSNVGNEDLGSTDEPSDTSDDDPDEPRGAAEPKLRRVKESKGCAVVRSAASRATRTTPWAMVVGLAFLVRARRRQR